MPKEGNGAVCPLCSSVLFEHLNTISKQQAAINKEIENARRTGKITIKQLSHLLDQADKLKQERYRIMDQFA